MQSRHRIPTIFSIYMVDVLCCALGCVVLLWQVNVHEVEEQSSKARLALESLESANLNIKTLGDSLAEKERYLNDHRKVIDQLTIDLTKLRHDRDIKLNLTIVLQKQFEDAVKARELLKALLDEKILELTKNVNDLTQKNTVLAKKGEATAAELAGQLRQNLALSQKIKQSQQDLANLEKDLLARKAEVEATSKKLEDNKILLALTEGGKRNLEKLLEELRTQGKSQLARLNESTIRSTILESDLDRTRKSLAAITKQYQELLDSQNTLSARLGEREKDLEKLRAENKLLVKQAVDIRNAAERRFAGIALTGNRVVFLVDMSGSMELVDENTPDPDKWPIVAESVGKVMQSLPDLKQYQVVLFSDKARYLAGGEGKWFDYLGQPSVKATVDAIKAIKPKGGTNMHAAFAEVFRYRDLGLDTVYFFSDGLPTSGEGLPADASKLTDTQITDLLSRNIRKNLKTVWNQPLPDRRKVRINTIGFYFESPEVGAFLWALAREHEGSFVGMSRP